MKNLLNRPIIKNTLYILITNFLIRFLGLFYRIIITRILGLEGMSLYVLIIPTIFLFITTSTLSINISSTKIISECLETKKLSPYKVLKEGKKLLFKSQIITVIIFLLLFRFIAYNLLKNELLVLPLLFSIPSYFITGYTDLLKGYYNGLKKMKYSCNATLIEQIFRIISSVLLVILYKDYGIVVSVSVCVLSDALGEAISLLYLLFHIKKDIIKYDNTLGEKKELLKICIPQTLNRLVNSFTMFLEPIIYTNILLFLYNKEIITNFYTTFTAYALPLISIIMFIPQAINNATLPNMSEIFIKQNNEKSSKFLSKVILFSIIPGILSTIILYVYSSYLMNFLYKTTIGVDLVKKIVIFYSLYYIHLPLITALTALGKTKLNFITSTCCSCIKLLLIIVFTNKGLYSIIYASIICLILHTIINYIQVNKLIKLKFDINIIIKLTLITLITVCLSIILNYLNIHALLSIIIITFTYLILLLFLKSTSSGTKSSLLK